MKIRKDVLAAGGDFLKETVAHEGDHVNSLHEFAKDININSAIRKGHLLKGF